MKKLIILFASLGLGGCVAHTFLASEVVSTVRFAHDPIPVDQLKADMLSADTAYFIIRNVGDCQRKIFWAAPLSKKDALRSFGAKDLIIGDTRQFSKQKYTLPKNNGFYAYPVPAKKSLVIKNFIKSSYGTGNSEVVEYFKLNLNPYDIPSSNFYYLASFNAVSLDLAGKQTCKASFTYSDKDMEELKGILLPKGISVIKAEQLEKTLK